MAGKGKAATFEQAKEKLDGIVEKLSAGSLPIAEMVRLYEEGAELARHCLKLLEEYEGRIEQVDKACAVEEEHDF